MESFVSFIRSMTNQVGLTAAVLLVFPLFLVRTIEIPASTPDSAFADALWIADSNAILKVSKDTGDTMLKIPSTGRIDALAVSRAELGALWTYGRKSLAAYSVAGDLIFEGRMKGAGESDDDKDGSSPHLAASREDGSVWLALGKSLHHFDEQGKELQVISIGDKIKALSVDSQRNYLWVATKKRLEAYNTHGELIQSIALAGSPHHRDIAYDATLDALWEADRRTVRRFDVADGNVLSVRELSETVSYLAPDYQGGLWIAAGKKLLKLDPTGLEQLSLRPFSKKIVEVVSEPADGSVWVASRDAVRHISAIGDILHDVDLGAGRDARRDDDDESGRNVRALALFIELNRRPVAEAGDDINTLKDLPVYLDGTGSFDPDGDLITFQWELSQSPEGSTADFDDATLPKPRFAPDVPGDFQFELVVSDGALASPPNKVSVQSDETFAKLNARAGDDQYALVGGLAALDGTASNDPNGLSFEYLWTFLNRPLNSLLTDADIALADTPHAQFTPDVAGAFVLNLHVTNGFSTDDDTMVVLATESNVPPNADAGEEHAVRLSEEVALDGGASFDPDAGPAVLAFRWSFVSLPPGSAIGSVDMLGADEAVVRFTPDVEGSFVARLEVDDGHSKDGDNTAVIADGTPPTVKVTAPGDGATIQDPRPGIAVKFADTGSGIDPDSFQLLINGADVTGATVVSGDGAIYTPGADLPFGDNRVVARISDQAGNRVEDKVNFTLFVFRAIADCGPATGIVPHSVTFRSRGQFTGGSIVGYRWDLDGDGSYDTSDSLPADYSRTFNAPGNYNAVLEVRNNFGEIATDTCAIVAEPQGPTASASASPSNGPVPLTVALSCLGQSPNGAITQWEWDLDGDGAYDYNSATNGATEHTYTSIGEFHARCRVTDAAGLAGVSGVINTTVRPRPAGSPNVTASASPISGTAPLVVSLGAADASGSAIVLYEWDFEGDGIYDYSSPFWPDVRHTYDAGGVFGATLRVTDDAGRTSADSVAIEVNVSADLSIPADTFEPEIGQSAMVRTSFSGRVPVRLKIRDRIGKHVRTLVDETRVAGTYDDAWDGRDRGGNLLPDGDYYAILEYDVGSQTKRIDLTDTTGGTRYSPARTGLPSSFDPYDNNPLPITFTVPSNQGASEILAFIGLFNSDTRLVTLLDREPRGVGTHTIYWDGLLPDGSLAVAPPGDTFLFGLWGYRLPDNALYIRSAPTLSSVAVHPTQFNPLSVSSPSARVDYALDQPATVEFLVRNLDTGRILRRITQYVDPTGGQGTLSVYRNDFESGVGLWTHGGGQDEWELGAPTSGPHAAHSGAYAWGTDLDSNYGDRGNQWLLSPEIMLPSDASSVLEFYQHFNSEFGYDFGYLEASTDGGSSFQQLSSYSGNRGGWERQVFDLGSLAGHSVRLRFRFSSDCCYTRSGWYVDDIDIQASKLFSIAWDGRTDDGIYAANGDYRLELRATDVSGGVSLVRYTLVRVFY